MKRRRTDHCLAFSLPEVLISVLAVGIIASIAVAFIGSVDDAIDARKLETDVRLINSAADFYRANGGSLDGITDPQDVIDKLKTRRTVEDAVRFVGFQGSTIDPRLSVRPLGASQEATDRPRARWNPATSHFDVVTTGPGIEEFYLDEALAVVDFGTEARETSPFDYNPGEGWVWPYRDRAPDAYLGPKLISLSDPGDSGLPPADPGQTKLLPPDISPPSDFYPSDDFPIPVVLTNPNPDSTWIMFSIDSGPLTRYATPLSISPGSNVIAFADGDPALWIQSGTVSADYLTDAPPSPLDPPIITLSAPGFSDPADLITVTITNPNPPGSSMIHYAIMSNGGHYPGVPSWPSYGRSFTLSAANYPDGTGVKAYAKAGNPAAYADSGFTEAIVTASFFFGLPITEDVLFVLDASSSMNADFGGLSRYEAVIDATVDAISDLPSHRKFSVVMFDAGIHWTDGSFQLENANPANKASMISQIREVDNDSGTNYEAGLSLPTRFNPRPKMVIFLTDGEPNDNNYEDEVRALAAEGIKVYPFGLALDSDAMETLQDIATATGGTVTEIPSR